MCGRLILSPARDTHGQVRNLQILLSLTTKHRRCLHGYIVFEWHRLRPRLSLHLCDVSQPRYPIVIRESLSLKRAKSVHQSSIRSPRTHHPKSRQSPTTVPINGAQSNRPSHSVNLPSRIVHGKSTKNRTSLINFESIRSVSTPSKIPMTKRKMHWPNGTANMAHLQQRVHPLFLVRVDK